MEPPTPKLFFAQMDSLNDCLVIENLAQVNQTYGKIITVYQISHHVTSHHITKLHPVPLFLVRSQEVQLLSVPGWPVLRSTIRTSAAIKWKYFQLNTYGRGET